MEAVFLTVLNTSLKASVLVLAIALIRLLLRKRAPRGVICLLWGLLALRLLFPFSLTSVFSLLPSAEPVPEEILYVRTPRIQSGIEAVDRLVNPALSQAVSEISAGAVTPVRHWMFVLSVIWLLGTAGLYTYSLVTFLILKRRVRTATLYQEGIWQDDSVGTPFVLGFLRPVIYLPYRIGEEELRYVLAHERAHIQRRDHWWKPLGFLLLSVYWFDPVMWLGYVLFCRDIEAACDERVIRYMDRKARRDYAETLLRLSLRRGWAASGPLSFGEISIKERVKRVMDYRRPTHVALAAAVLLLGVTALCFLTDPEEGRLWDPMKPFARTVAYTFSDGTHTWEISFRLGREYRLSLPLSGISYVEYLGRNAEGKEPISCCEIVKKGDPIFSFTITQGILDPEDSALEYQRAARAGEGNLLDAGKNDLISYVFYRREAPDDPNGYYYSYRGRIGETVDAFFIAGHSSSREEAEKIFRSMEVRLSKHAMELRNIDINPNDRTIEADFYTERSKEPCHIVVSLRSDSVVSCTNPELLGTAPELSDAFFLYENQACEELISYAKAGRTEKEMKVEWE